MKRTEDHIEQLHENCGAKCQPNHINASADRDVPSFLSPVDNNGWKYIDDINTPYTTTLETPNSNCAYVISRDVENTTVTCFLPDYFSQVTILPNSLIDDSFETLINPNNFDAWFKSLLNNAVAVKCEGCDNE